MGNPHLVAEVDKIDLELLTKLGQQVKEQPDLLPKGVNVSLFRRTGEQEIYTATYERGVGLTSSCGTAMTACSTAACLLGLCRTDEPIRVLNSGGMVRCCCHRTGEEITTALSGNATYEAMGTLEIDLENGCFTLLDEHPCHEEIEAYNTFLKTIS